MNKRFALVAILTVLFSSTVGCAYVNPSKTSSYQLKDGPLRSHIEQQWSGAKNITVDASNDNADTVRWTVDGVPCAGLVNGIRRGTTPVRFVAVPYCMGEVK